MKRLGTLPACAAAFIAAYFLWLTGHGLWTYFHPDDLMNLYGWWAQSAWKLVTSNLLYFSPAYRPMGGVFYSVLFAIFGFDPLPFRVAVFALLLGNLLLVYFLARRLTGSREVAGLAVLLGCCHRDLYAIYESTGAVYDVLCFSFYYGALLYYVRIRQSGRRLGPLQLAAFCALYACALNSKEMAVSLPLLVGAYELIYAPPDSWHLVNLWSWLKREGRGALIAAAMTVPYLIGKAVVPGPLVTPAYLPRFSASLFMSKWQDYLGQLFQDAIRFDALGTIALWLGLLIVVWRLRQRALWFAAVVIAASMLPLVFTPPHRSGYVLYIPLVGWALYAAALLVRGRDALLQAFERLRQRAGAGLGRPVPPAWVQVFLFVGVAAALVPVNQRVAPDEHWVKLHQTQVQSVAEVLRREHPAMRPRASVLFIGEPLPDWTTTFLLRLYYRDDTLTASRVGADHPDASRPGFPGYDYVFRWQGQELRTLKAPPRRAVEIVNASRPNAAGFYVGETLRAAVKAPPKERVVVTARRDGGQPATVAHGTTDSSGRLTVTRTLTAEDLGSWQEDWEIGGHAVPTLRYQVQPRPPVTVRLSNQTRPGVRDFVVGDKFLVVATGPAGEAVTAKASQNGGALASATFGFTGADGRFSLTGEMHKRELGSWQEEWAVGGVPAKPVRFVVRPR
jgi:hypothetical protein